MSERPSSKEQPPVLTAPNRPPPRQFGSGPFGGGGLAEKPLTFHTGRGQLACRPAIGNDPPHPKTQGNPTQLGRRCLGMDQ